MHLVASQPRHLMQAEMCSTCSYPVLRYAFHNKRRAKAVSCQNFQVSITHRFQGSPKTYPQPATVFVASLEQGKLSAT